MTRVPQAPLVLGLVGLVPFIWGALTYLNPSLQQWGADTLGARFIGPYVQLFYGAVILGFMSGVLWGFATRATSGGQAATAYVLSVIPALWAFLMTGGGPVSASVNLIFGYAGLLLIDIAFARWNLTPDWWLFLRVPLTAIVILCLSVGVFL